ncbi:type IV secretion system DNA-binding domain-containing protein [Candidatus Parcubacteria bacterium]|nr:type IV secretion system DNA-binding domain-containing protein [Candidatus Parcubacteria bacterium]
MDKITFFAETTFRNIHKKFGIKPDDRRRHMYIVGKTGMGKTALLENMAIQDIQAGHGVGFVDPHGEAAEKLLDFIPSRRINDVVYFNPSDLDWPIAFNIMEKVDVKYRHLVAGGLMGVFKKIWPDVWSARMEYILNNCILALLEYQGSTLLGVNRMLSDVEYRKKVVDKVTDPIVRAFWTQEFASYSQRYETEATAAIQNKVGQLISSPLIRNIIGQVKSTINMREIMDKKKILILNLSKGRVGEDASRLIGALLITKIQLAAMSRVDMPEDEREDFYLYVDEFQNFATESFINILSEARKYRLNLILAHQYISQMEEEVRDAVFGNVGTIVSYRVGADDAEYLEKEFTPEFFIEDLINLAKYNIYLKLMIDGIAGKPFSARTLPPFPIEEEADRDKIIKVSREKYATSCEIVEEKISKWTEGINISESQKASPILYDAKCSGCGKLTKVTFKPDGVRPVYCKSCLKKMETEAAPKAPLSGVKAGEPRPENSGRENNNGISLENAIGREPIAFSPPKEKNKDMEKPTRKAPDIGEVKDAILDALRGKKKEEEGTENSKKGRIEPGETVRF